MQNWIKFIVVSTLVFHNVLLAQKQVKINWNGITNEVNLDHEEEQKIYFENAFYLDTFPQIPVYVSYLPIATNINLVEIELINYTTTKISADENIILQKQKVYPTNLNLKTVIKQTGNQKFIQIYAYPLFKNNGVWEKVNQFTFKINELSIPSSSEKSAQKSAQISPLANGYWYKFAVVNDGMYSINFADLQRFGFNPNSIDPRNIQIYGNGLGELPELLSATYPTTLTQCAIEVVGENDGVFNANDRIIFYAKGPDDLKLDASEMFVDYKKNRYADSAYYFITVGNIPGKRIQNYNQNPVANQNVSTYWDVVHRESNSTNLIKSGKAWYGDIFDVTTTRNYSFSLPSNLIPNTNGKLKVEGALRSFSSFNNVFSVFLNGNNAGVSNVASAVSVNYTSIYARKSTFVSSLNFVSGNNTVQINYVKPLANSIAWLDFITLNLFRNLSFSGSSFVLFNPENIGVNNVNEYIVTTNQNISVWNVTDALNPIKLSVQNNGNTQSFVYPHEKLEFFTIHNGTNYNSVLPVGVVANQNLLGLVDVDYIIICPKAYNNEASRLANFHQTQNNLSVAVVNLPEIYNEFSAGKQDVTAIRNFMKYLYENASSSNTRLKYLLLLGDASYDYKNVLTNNTNIVPIYQSEESLSPLATFASDDFYGIFKAGTSVYTESGDVEIGIGRFPAKNTSEAKVFVDKTIAYQQIKQFKKEGEINIPIQFGNWKNEIMFVSDDGNGEDDFTNAHFLQTEFLMDNIIGLDSNYNARKIHMDFYPKIPGAGGGKYPDVNRDINTYIEQGTSVVSYIGHGGGSGWADERVLEFRDIQNWRNINSLPLFVTATCEFTRFDDPSFLSAGERLVLSPTGGTIAMLTTMRLVFGGFSNNIGFSKNFFDQALDNRTKNPYTLGDAMRITKVVSPMGSSFNSRKFSLLGDPATRLTLPKLNVKTTQILVENTPNDTIKALSKVRVKGEIVDKNNVVQTGFNGILYPTVLDKKQINFTRDNNNRNVVDSFYTQNSILFKGKASVTNGLFDFEFIVPKDINYQFGKGKISYYVAGEEIDGNGFNQNFIVGGSNPNAVNDAQPPIIQLTLNDSSFVSGSLSDQNPLVIAKISDNYGINISGNGIGRNMTITIDGDVANSIVVNNFFRSDINSYQSGKLEYRLGNLSEGEHTLTVKAWDIHNNSSEETITFIVSNSKNFQLKNVLNYPNPFTTHTDFMFEHNQKNSSLDVQITIFTITGKVIKTIRAQLDGNTGFAQTKIPWDGLDDFGSQIGRGVYIYNLKVKASNGLEAEKNEKLVILR
ncbi:MAG: hypothetical protein RLZZ414_1028 [Bacteroidota bacterium]|jgi:hypothetical protein